jgi:hypothetical protein
LPIRFSIFQVLPIRFSTEPIKRILFSHFLKMSNQDTCKGSTKKPDCKKAKRKSCPRSMCQACCIGMGGCTKHKVKLPPPRKNSLTTTDNHVSLFSSDDESSSSYGVNSGEQLDVEEQEVIDAEEVDLEQQGGQVSEELDVEQQGSTEDNETDLTRGDNLLESFINPDMYLKENSITHKSIVELVENLHENVGIMDSKRKNEFEEKIKKKFKSDLDQLSDTIMQMEKALAEKNAAGLEITSQIENSERLNRELKGDESALFDIVEKFINRKKK